MTMIRFRYQVQHCWLGACGRCALCEDAFKAQAGELQAAFDTAVAESRRMQAPLPQLALRTSMKLQ